MIRTSRLLAVLAVLAVNAAPAVSQYRFVRDDAALRTHFDNEAWDFVARQPCRRIDWRPDVRSTAALASSLAPLRRELLEAIGPLPIPPRPRVIDSREVYSDSTFTVTLVAIAGGFPSTTIAGYLARPSPPRPIRATAVVFHGSNATPEEAFGWRFADTDARVFTRTPISTVGTALLSQGFAVFVPFISDAYQFDYVFPWSDLENLGESYRSRTGYGGTISLVMGQALASIEFARSQASVGPPRTLVVGWAEGALIASIAAALDPRIDAVVNLLMPRDSRALRSASNGVRINAAFAHYDCVFGNVEQAAMIAPRSLAFAWADDDVSTLRAGRYRSALIDEQLDRIYALAPRGTLVRVNHPKGNAAMAFAVARWASRRLGTVPLADSLGLAQPKGLSYPGAAVAAALLSLNRYVSSFGPCLPIPAIVDARDATTLRVTSEILRERVRSHLGLSRTPRQRQTRVVTRQLVLQSRDYRLEWVVLRSGGEAREIGGLLATPTVAAGSRLPAVLTFDGNYGVSQVFGLPPVGRTAYLNAYGDDLARAGIVVFAPYRPPIASRLPGLLRARGAEVNRLAFELDLARASLDFLLDEPAVDPSDVVAYGVSEAGYAATLATAFDQRIEGLVFSNPLISHKAAFRDPSSVTATAWQTQVCSTMDAIMKYLIPPRRFTWEGDSTDLSFFAEPPLSFAASIQEVYRNIGAAESFRLRRHLFGHSTHPMLMRDALPFKRAMR